MSDMDLYAQYFPVGRKVGVGIPLPNAEIFKDWAIIHKIEEDLVSLQLSRDVLPADVLLHYGQILELRGGSEGNGYCCRAIVVSEGDASELLLRLIGEIVSDELREFYRIDAYLPIKYFVTHEQDIDFLKKQWKERQEHRRQLELEEKDQRWISPVLPEVAELPDEHPDDLSETAEEVATLDKIIQEEEALDSWDNIIPLAANISGSGLRIITHQGFQEGEYALLEIFVPTPQRVIDVIGRVVFANRNFAAGSDHEYFNTGLQFVYIDERDRDAIVNYISTIQLKRIRQLRERYLYRSVLEDEVQFDQTGRSGLRRKATRILSTLFFILFFALLINFFWHYTLDHPKGEIQRTFEEGVKKYREPER